jgi:glycosyltransferase involved in cell wall biosynthesis
MSSVLRVGFDATQLPRHGAGTYSYILNLATALARLPAREFEFVIVVKQMDRHLFEGLTATEVVSVRLRSRPHRLVWEQLSLGPLLSRHRIDLLHSPHYTLPLGASLARVVTFHDLTYLLMPEMHSRSRRWFFRWMIPRSARAADHIVCDSVQTRADLHALYPELPLSKSTIVPAGIDACYHSAIVPSAIERTLSKYHLCPNYVLHVGTIEPRKNIETALRAVETLRQGGVDTLLVLAGRQGWLSNEAMATLLNSASCRVLGHVPFEDLRSLYAGAGAVVMPSHYEGFGLPVVEGMAAGVPVVSSGKGSLREVSGPAAIIPRDDTVEDYADALRTALRRGPARDAVIQRGKEWARQFSWERSAALVARVYSDVWVGQMIRRSGKAPLEESPGRELKRTRSGVVA